MEPGGSWPNYLAVQAPIASRRKIASPQLAPRGAMAVLSLYIIFEYLRIHEILPMLGKLQVQTVISGSLLLIVLTQIGKTGTRLPRQSLLLLGFLGLTAFTILPATNQFRAYLFAYGLALTLIGYFAITHILRNARDVKRFLSVLVGIHIFIAVKGVLRGSLAMHGVGGYILGDENDLALAMIVILPFAIYLFRQTRSQSGRLFWGAGSVVILLAVIFTFSRGGFVGLGAMTLYWVLTSRNKRRAIGALVLAAALVATVAPSGYWAEVQTITEVDQGTAQGRRNAWAAAQRMFLDSPIWGVGGYNFGVLFPDYALEYSSETRPTRWGKAAHSMFFDLLAEFGLLGVLLIGYVLLLNFRDLRQVISLSRSGRCPPSIGQLAGFLRVSWVGFLVPAAFLSVLGYPHLYYLTALTVVVHRLAFAELEAVAIEPVGVLQKAG